MEQLRPADPVFVGGHRLLRRLGAGGMGRVCPARGTLHAVLPRPVSGGGRVSGRARAG
ncbi:hypothetical protein [Streptomyces paludis]|uniref:hypothetical protein n=1 Tax=Streptomyces paludis TaxID=2282738 RepID=UPI0013B436C1|nr:hypothetical protein [Streptomyces paludis]